MGKLMFGTVWSNIPEKGMVRVEFAEDEITSVELPYLVPGTGGDTKMIYPLAVGTQVACLMDEHLESGVCLGAIYSASVAPGAGSATLYRTQYDDGSVVEYDSDTHIFTVNVDQSQFKISEDGFIIAKGGENLKKIISDLIDAILAETHTTSTGPSGTPINATQYTAIKNRLPQLFG